MPFGMGEVPGAAQGRGSPYQGQQGYPMVGVQYPGAYGYPGYMGGAPGQYPPGMLPYGAGQQGLY